MAPDITNATPIAQSQHICSSATATTAKDTTVNDTSDATVIDNNSTLHYRKYEIDKCNNIKQADNKTTTTIDGTTEMVHDKFEPQIRWPDLIVQIFLHSGACYGLYLCLFASYLTYFWVFLLVLTSGFGITAGAHRLWSHRAYKAKWQLRLVLIFLFSIAGQRDAYTWAHDHRVHHKYSETNADPHDARRGFFFAHVGWLVLTPHPEVVAKRKIIDMSDLENDSIVMWQKKYYEIIFAIMAIAMPVLVPWYFWNESIWSAFWICFNLRFCTTLNIAFFVNSVAHMYGNRPYDKHISPVENLAVSVAALGEGWHNYHHVFPWDYKTGELGNYTFNLTTGFIDTFAKFGWAYDRKFVSKAMIQRRIEKSGDGTHFLDDTETHKDAVWGLGDTDITKDDLDELNQMSN